MSKIDKLLAVLDMPEDEQDDWCRQNTMPYLWRDSLADLAFQLRDEAVVEYPQEWQEGKRIVYESFTGHKTKLYDMWFANVAQSIHWIVASLITKELAGKAK